MEKKIISYCVLKPFACMFLPSVIIGQVKPYGNWLLKPFTLYQCQQMTYVLYAIDLLLIYFMLFICIDFDGGGCAWI